MILALTVWVNKRNSRSLPGERPHRRSVVLSAKMSGGASDFGSYSPGSHLSPLQVQRIGQEAPSSSVGFAMSVILTSHSFPPWH
jgi:hypothetical protein